MLLRAESSDVAGVPVVSLSGRADLATIPTLQSALVRAISSAIGELVAVDLDGVDNLDDTAIGVLLGAAGRARGSGGDVVVVCSNDALLRRFSITRLDQAIRIVPTVAALAG